MIPQRTVPTPQFRVGRSPDARTVRPSGLPALLAGALLTLLVVSTLPAQAPTTVFVVRHAERESTESDSPLSEAGRARAERLAMILRDAGITHLFSTEYLRTRATVGPLGERLGIAPVTIPARDLPALLETLRALPPGSRAVVAGHSNTINRIAGGLSGAEIPELPETEYDRLYMVTMDGATVSAVLLRY